MFQLWIPALLWLAVIAWESAMLSTGETSRFILPLLHLLLPHGTEQQFGFLHAMLRKAGHFTGYCILSLLLYRAWWGTIVLRKSASPPRRVPGWKAMFAMWSARAMTLAWLGTALVASLDELQQSLHSSRTGSPKDVLLDSAGGWFAQMMLLAASSHWMRRRYAPSGFRPRAKTRSSTAETAERRAESSGSSAP
jgi:VanZ family protein